MRNDLPTRLTGPLVMNGPVSILDVGARGGIRNANPRFASKRRWHHLLANKTAWCATAIEPDPDEALRLAATSDYEQVHAIGIYDRHGQVSLYLTNDDGARASLLEPDMQVLKEHHRDPSRLKFFEVQDVLDINVTTLDQLMPDARFDWIKLDIQGVEYQAIAGGTRLVEKRAMLLLECVTHPYYRHQVTRDRLVERCAKLGFEVLVEFPKPQLPIERDLVMIKRADVITDVRMLAAAMLGAWLFSSDRHAAALAKATRNRLGHCINSHEVRSAIFAERVHALLDFKGFARKATGPFRRFLGR